MSQDTDKNLGKHLNTPENEPGEIISRGPAGDILAPLQLPPELAELSQDWANLTYDQKIEDLKKRTVEDRLRLLRVLGGVCRNAVQLVREFRPLIEVLREEFSQPGRRLPLEGRPSWTEFVRTTFGFTPRRIQQLLADRSPSTAVPRSNHPKKNRAAVKSRDDKKIDRVVTLGLQLAKKVLDYGFADKFPEAVEILSLVKLPAKPRPSKPGTQLSRRDRLASPKPKEVSTSVRPEQPAKAKVITQPEQRAHEGNC